MTLNLFYKQAILFAVLFCGYTSFSQKTISDLSADLNNTTVVKDKADICYSLSYVYSSRLKVDSALFFANKIKEFSLAANYHAGMGKHYLAVAAALILRRKTEEAEDNARKAIEIFREEKNNQFLGISYRQLARIYDIDKEYELAKKNYWAAIHYSILATDSNTLSREYFELGAVYFFIFEADSSITYYTKALRISEKLNDRSKIFISAGYLGALFLNLKDFVNAREYLEYSLRSRLPASDKVLTRVWLYNYAYCLFLMHEFQKGDSVVKEFEKMNLVLNDTWGKVFLSNLKGIAGYERDDYQQAFIYFRDAYNMQPHNEVSFYQKNIIIHLGETEFRLQKYDSAIVHLKVAAKLSHQLRHTIDEMESSFLISKSFEKINKPDSALYYFRNYSFLKDSILSLEKQRTIIEVFTKYESEKKEQEIKILQKESDANSLLLQLRNEQIEKQQLEDEKKSQAMDLISKQNEINKLDASQKTLSLDNEKKENEKKQVRLQSLEKESALQTTIARNQKQRKNFAYGLIGLILIFSGYGYYRYRQNKKLSSQLSHSLAELKQAQAQLIKFEKEKESESIRVRISRDIHDEVGATLSGVALFSEIAKQKMEQHNETDAKIYLDHISANSKDMVEKMGDIVWTINPENDSIDRIVSRLKAYAVNLCGGKGIQIHFQVDEAIKDFFPDMPERKNIYLFSKEAINNAVKYSNGSTIFFSILKNNNKVALEIKDDGIGFDTKSMVKGNGLINMQARADELKAVLDVLSKPGKGTCIKLNIDFHPIGGQRGLV